MNIDWSAARQAAWKVGRFVAFLVFLLSAMGAIVIFLSPIQFVVVAIIGLILFFGYLEYNTIVFKKKLGYKDDE